MAPRASTSALPSPGERDTTYSNSILELSPLDKNVNSLPLEVNKRVLPSPKSSCIILPLFFEARLGIKPLLLLGYPSFPITL